MVSSIGSYFSSQQYSSPVNSVELNKSPDSTYFMLPLNREMNGLKITSQNGEDIPQVNSQLQNLDELRNLDTDGNNIISISELEIAQNRTAFMDNLLARMKNFDSNFYSNMLKNN